MSDEKKVAVEPKDGKTVETESPTAGEVEKPEPWKAGDALKIKLPVGAAMKPEPRKAGETLKLKLPGGAAMKMVWCPPGTFKMGSPEEEAGRGADETQHEVTLEKGFWMAMHPVTQLQWASVMKDNPSRFWSSRLPVERVSWLDCRQFCQQVGFQMRLPTEEEWEYACRAGSEGAYFWGDKLNGDRANCQGQHPYGTDEEGPYTEQTTRAGRYEGNAWGLQDMHGNVWEWCEDPYGTDPTSAKQNPGGGAPQSAFFAAGVGGARRGTAGRRAVWGLMPAATATTSASVLSALLRVFRRRFGPRKH